MVATNHRQSRVQRIVVPHNGVSTGNGHIINDLGMHCIAIIN